MIHEILAIEDLVKKILAECPETRSDDKALVIKLWEHQGLHLSTMQKEAFLLCSTPESITRARRKIQEEGMYQADDKTQLRRSKNDAKIRAYFVGEKRKPIRYDFTSKPGVAIPVYEQEAQTI